MPSASATTESLVLLDIKDKVATITLHRPSQLNALNSALLQQLEQTLINLRQDLKVGVIVLTGSGEKAFAAGADIKEMLELDPALAVEFSRRGQSILSLLESFPCPVIAAINGHALGGGLEVALFCDLLYAAENAKIGLPEVGLGVIPGFGGTQNLARLIGPHKAKEMIFTGKVLSAQEAYQIGILNAVLPANELLPHVYQVAKTMLQKGTLAKAYAKEAIHTGLQGGKQEGLKFESLLFGQLFYSAEKREGMTAFVEKRTPQF